MKIKLRSLFRMIQLLTAVSCAALLVGCGGGGGGTSGNSGGTSGTLNVVMTDGLDPTITNLTITIDKVEANINGNWQTVTSVPQTFNLLDLVTNERILGSASLPAGHYTQIRLFPSSATVTDSTGTHNVAIASADQTGIKLNVDYDLGGNQITTVLLDFNVSKSLIKEGNGQYRLQPVIPAVVKVLSGTVSGSVTLNGTPVKGAAVTAVYTAGSSYPVNTEVNTSASLAGGTFKVWALLPGTYTITATYTDASNVTRTAVKTGVVVSANQNVDVGVLGL